MITYSYNDIEEISKKLAKEINKDYSTIQPIIITLTKGGTFSTSFISKYLNWKPSIISIGDTDVSWDFVGKEQAYIVIDDILDTGKTVKNLNYDDLMHYFLVYKHTDNNIWKPRWSYAQEIVKDDWVKFPWEAYETN